MDRFAQATATASHECRSESWPSLPYQCPGADCTHSGGTRLLWGKLESAKRDAQGLLVRVVEVGSPLGLWLAIAAQIEHHDGAQDALPRDAQSYAAVNST